MADEANKAEEKEETTNAANALYEDDDTKEDEAKEDESPHDEEGADRGEESKGAEVDPNGIPDAPPEGHEEFLKHLEHAFQTHPVMHGMHQEYMAACKRYADEMAGQDQPPQEGEVPPEQGAEEGAGDEEKKAAEKAAEDEAMSGGETEMPKPEGDEESKPYGFSVENLVPGGTTMKKASGGTLGALAGGAAGLGAGMLTGHPIAGTAIGAGLGGGLGAMRSNDPNVPVSYAALQSVVGELSKMKSELGQLKKASAAKDKELSRLSQKSSEKEVDLLMYQFGQLGIKNTVDKTSEEYKAIRQHLLGLGESDRQAKAAEILAYWDRDETVAYAAKGAPVGEFLQIDERRVEGNYANKPRTMTEKEQEVALKRLRSNPPTHKGMSYEEKWEECKAYAMNGQVVTS